MDFSNYRSIPTVLDAKTLIDSSLSKTQRKTPTEIHKHFDISRIRKFYMRKVKFTQQTFHDKLNGILESFPQIQNIHPFYADLINVLYDKDHFKIALGKINISKGLVDRTGNEYVRLLKYGDSLFRCKSLKRIALGKMVTIVKKLDKTLKYLEEVRKHLCRLPTIDPFGKSIILCGFPNVGKSSFLNSVSRADVEVEPYPFTTKSLYLGQSDYNYIRFQFIDTPGILDQPLENRNTIEMQAITALAHLRASVIYMFDISETCGYSIKEQVNLFESLRVLLQNKPIVLGLNKIDLVQTGNLSSSDQELLAKLEAEGFKMMPLSTQNKEGVMELRDHACDLVLSQLQEKSHEGGKKSKNAPINGLYVAFPKKRDDKHRPAMIPIKFVENAKNGGLSAVAKRPTEKEVQLTMGDEYIFDPRKQYLIPEEYKYDVIPEICDGKNISDFVDVNIVKKLNDLVEEETKRDELKYYEIPKWNYFEIKSYMDRELMNEKRMVKKAMHASKKSKTTMPRPVLSKSKDRKQSRINSAKNNDSSDGDDISSGEEATSDIEVAASYSDNYINKLKKSGVYKSNKNVIGKTANKKRKALQGESGPNRHIYDLKPKHLFSGKRKGGKTQRR